MRKRSIIRVRVWSQLHQWTGILVGGFVIIWVVSTLAMISNHAPSPPATGTSWETLTISPAVAIRLSSTTPDTMPVRSLRFLQIGERMVWQVQRRGRAAVLVDAARGDIVTIRREEAVAIARNLVQGPVKRATLLSHHDLAFVNGQLPVYRVEFEDHRTAYVNVRDGSTQVLSMATGIGDLHLLRVVDLLPKGRIIRIGTLTITGLVALLLTITGYWLWYIRSRARRPQGRPR